MAGLVGYGSSDEEDDVREEMSEAPQLHDETKSEPATELEPQNGVEAPPTIQPEEQKEPPAAQPPAPGPSIPPDSAPFGPRLPPAGAPVAGPYDSPYPASPDGPSGGQGPSAPLSPYSANRALLRDLTLPAVPNLDIPSSPPGSPDPSSSLNRKFDAFLELKRKKGTHFNARLAQSSALRNPAVTDKLLAFVGLGDPGSDSGPAELAAQYATTLPSEVWDPAAFPGWAFRGPLRKSQEKVQKEREAARAKGMREGIDFVPAVAPGSGPGTVAGLSRGGSRSGTPGTAGSGTALGRKSRFDT